MLERLPIEVAADERFVFDVQVVSNESLEFIEATEDRTGTNEDSVDPGMLRVWEPSCVLELRLENKLNLVLS
jgi:hypothetical protein